MNKIQKAIYEVSTTIKELYKKVYETGDLDAFKKDFLFLLQEENQLYQSLSIRQIVDYINTLPTFESDDITSIMLGDYSFNPLFRILNRIQYFLHVRCMYSEEMEMDLVSFSTLINARWAYLYNEILFENLFYYYRLFMSIKKDCENYLFLSLLITAYTYTPLENKLVQFSTKQEQSLTNTIFKYSGISNIQESLDQSFYENIMACLESFCNTNFNAMFCEKEEQLDCAISQIFYLGLYRSISNKEMRSGIRKSCQLANLPHLSLKHQQFLDEMQRYFTVCEYKKQLKKN